MNRLSLLIIILFISLVNTAMGYEIVVVKSSSSRINEQVQHTFFNEISRNSHHHGLKSIQPNQLTEIVIARGEKTDDSIRKIRSIQPDLILALGARALRVSLAVSGVPIVHLLVIDAGKIIGNTSQVAGVSLTVPPQVQLAEMSRCLPEVRRIGLIYDPKRSGKFIEQLRSIRPDLEFISLAAENSTEVPGLITSLRGRVDLLWMLPDLTTTNRKTFQSYVLFSMKNRIPLLTFSEKFLKHGATIAITFDTDAMAGQAANLALDMLSGRYEVGQAVVAPLSKTVINHKIAAKLNISIEGGGQNQ